MYAKGRGVTQDYAEAVKWYRLAAEQGLATAEFGLGVMYESGQGVAPDSAEAVKWYRLAATQGYANAQANLGFMYDIGKGVKQDYAEVIRWYRLAAEQGDARAQSNLGIKYASGQGVKQDYAEAIKWYRLAAAQGFANAQYGLGIMYANGQGVPKDLNEAQRLLKLAADQNVAGAAKFLAEVQLQSAQTQAQAQAVQGRDKAAPEQAILIVRPGVGDLGNTTVGWVMNCLRTEKFPLDSNVPRSVSLSHEDRAAYAIETTINDAPLRLNLVIAQGVALLTSLQVDTAIVTDFRDKIAVSATLLQPCEGQR
jgi:TPR repeat protein